MHSLELMAAFVTVIVLYADILISGFPSGRSPSLGAEPLQLSKEPPGMNQITATRQSKHKALHMEIQISMVDRTKDPPLATSSHAVFDVNLVSSDFGLQMQMDMEDGQGFQLHTEQVFVAGELYVRGTISGIEGNPPQRAEWGVVPMELAPLQFDLTGVGSHTADDPPLDWSDALARVSLRNQAQNPVSGDAVPGVAVHHYTVEVGMEGAAELIKSINAVLTLGGRAFPLGGEQSRALSRPDARISFDLWIGVHDGFPYRILVISDDREQRSEMEISCLPLSEPIVIAAPE
jgi:hypothetical protein